MCGGNGIAGRRGLIGGALENFRPTPRAAAPFGAGLSARPTPRVAAPPAVSTGLESLPASPRRAQNR